MDVPEADDSNDVKNPLHDPVVAKIDDVNNDPQTTTPKPPRRTSETSEWARDVFSLTTSSGSEASQKKQRNLNRTVIVLLFVLGFAAGLINGVILLVNGRLCALQAYLVAQGGYFGQPGPNTASAAAPAIGLLYFLLAMLTSVALAAAACKYGAREAAGSGLPEFKYLLASEMKRGEYDRLVSRRIFLFKVIGLTLSVGGGLSVGSEGPLVSGWHPFHPAHPMHSRLTPHARAATLPCTDCTCMPRRTHPCVPSPGAHSQLHRAPAHEVRGVVRRGAGQPQPDQADLGRVRRRGRVQRLQRARRGLALLRGGHVHVLPHQVRPCAPSLARLLSLPFAHYTTIL